MSYDVNYPLKIVIIDDDQAFSMVLELRLKAIFPLGDIRTFRTLREARSYFQSGGAKETELSVIDQHLPDGHGTSLLAEGWCNSHATILVSADDTPQLAGQSIEAGAQFFLSKKEISQRLFVTLVKGLIERNNLQKQLAESRLNEAVAAKVKTLLNTLRHEILNPLGTVIGAMYIIEESGSLTPAQLEAASLVVEGGERIKEVLTKLCEAVAADKLQLNETSQGETTIFNLDL